MALRDLDYQIQFDVDNRGLRDAERNVDQLDRGLRGADDRMDDINNNISEMNRGFSGIQKLLKGAIVAKGLSILGRGIGFAKDQIIDLINTASDAEESISKFNVVFGNLADSTRDWINETSQLINRGRGDLRDYLGETQGVFFGFTDGSEQARNMTAEFSKQVVRMGVDLASFNNIADDDAIQRLQSGLSGNHDALRAMGIALNENVLRLQMQKLGIQGNFQNLDEFTKMQVRFSAAVDQSSTAIGDAERTGDSYQNQVKALNGELADMREELGKKLIPIASEFVGWIRKNEDSIHDLAEAAVDLVKRGLEAVYDIMSDPKSIETFKDMVGETVKVVNNLADGMVSVIENAGAFLDFFKGGTKAALPGFNILKEPETEQEYSQRIKQEHDDLMRAKDQFMEDKTFGNFMRMLVGSPRAEETTVLPNNGTQTTNATMPSNVNMLPANPNNINISVPVNVNNQQMQPSADMQAEIENFFGGLLVKHGYVSP
jgi:hypothetical protein